VHLAEDVPMLYLMTLVLLCSVRETRCKHGGLHTRQRLHLHRLALD